MLHAFRIVATLIVYFSCCYCSQIASISEFLLHNYSKSNALKTHDCVNILSVCVHVCNLCRGMQYIACRLYFPFVHPCLQVLTKMNRTIIIIAMNRFATANIYIYIYIGMWNLGQHTNTKCRGLYNLITWFVLILSVKETVSWLY